MVTVCSSDPPKGSCDLSNGVAAFSSESGLSGFLKGTLVYSFEPEVSETITIHFRFGMTQCILCVLGTASTSSHLAYNCLWLYWVAVSLSNKLLVYFWVMLLSYFSILLCCCCVHLPTSNMPPHCSLDCSPESIHDTFSMRCGEEVPCKL